MKGRSGILTLQRCSLRNRVSLFPLITRRASGVREMNLGPRRLNKRVPPRRDGLAAVKPAPPPPTTITTGGRAPTCDFQPITGFQLLCTATMHLPINATNTSSLPLSETIRWSKKQVTPRTHSNVRLIIALSEQTQLRSCVCAHAGKGARGRKVCSRFAFESQRRERR